MTMDRAVGDRSLQRLLSPGAGAHVEDYTAFYRAEFRPVARTVYLIVHDAARAEDLTQEAFLKLLQHWKKVSTYERPGAWVRRVAIRLATKHVRRESLRPVLERNAAPLPPPGPVDVDLLRAIAQLPSQQRAAVVLFYFEDRPVSEIVDLLGCTESAAKVWLHRARHRLADLLKEEVEDVS
jgi:DNA-directed RNA polymerase specialized sigma24 family protein